MKKQLLTLSVVLLLGAQGAFANGPYTPTLTSDSYDPTPNGIVTPSMNQDDSGVNLNDLFHAVNEVQGSSFTHNNQLDTYLFTGNDSYWSTNGGPSGLFTLIGLGASASNFLKVYDSTTPGTMIAINDEPTSPFSGFGIIASPYPAIGIPFGPGTTFGWNLRSYFDAPDDDWNSDPTKNIDGLDHMITYHLTDLAGKTVSLQVDPDPSVPSLEYTFRNPYLIGFEDLPVGQDGKMGDEDFNDLMFIVDGVAPVTTPEPVSTVLFLTGGAAMAGNLIRRRIKGGLI